MGNWSEVFGNLLSRIAKKMDKLDDFVCKSRQAAAVNRRPRLLEQVPYLMLVAEGDEREIYSITEHEIVTKITRSSFGGRKCIESLGWLLTVGVEGDMSLLNPITGVEIELPHHTTFPFIASDPVSDIHKMVLSSRPDHESSDFAVMVIGGTHNLGFWRPGDRVWNPIRRLKGPIRDITYFNGKFYALEYSGFVLVFDLAGSNPEKGRVLATGELLAQNFTYFEICEMNYYIGEIAGELLIILRDCRQHDDEQRKIFYQTRCFYLYKVDTLSGRWEQIHSLGNKAAFVGHNQTILVDTSEFCEFKANHIYYTTDAWHVYDQEIVLDPKRAGLDVGVYNVETEELEPFYQGDDNKLFNQTSPALWFIPNSITHQ